MNYIILNGVDSRTITGLLIQELPPITKPAMRTEIEEIDGRDGDISTPLGYAAYDKQLSIGLYGNFDINAVIAYFNSSGTVTFSNEPDKVYNYSIVQQIDFERLIRFRTATVTLHTQPFKFSTQQTAKTLTAETVSGQGASVLLEPTAAGSFLSSFSLYGNALQSDTPTPASPVTIQTVTGENDVIFTTPESDLTSTASLNLGTLELVKINTYQDYLHSNNGAWVKRTTIGKLTVDTATITAVTSYSNIAYAKIPIPTDAAAYGNYKDIPCLCSHALYSYGLNEGWNTAKAANKIFVQADANTFWVGFEVGTTLAQMQAALSGCVIYYPLLLPLDVAVSSDLAQQLNGVLEVSLFNGSTTITTNPANAKGTIAVSVIGEVFTIINKGNYYSRPKLTIYGSGTVTVNVNGNQIFTIALNNEGYITIDGAAMEATQGTTLKNRLVTGDYENFILNVGTNTISFSENVTQAIIENYSRWI